MKQLTVGLLMLALLSGCGSESAENERKLHNLIVTATASGMKPRWVLWMQLKELPRKPELLDNALHLVGASGLYSLKLPNPLVVYETEQECQTHLATFPRKGDENLYCLPVGYKQ